MSGCPALLDHDGERVLTCAYDSGEDHAIHYPGPWRKATKAEQKAISRADDKEAREDLPRKFGDVEKRNRRFYENLDRQERKRRRR